MGLLDWLNKKNITFEKECIYMAGRSEPKLKPPQTTHATKPINPCNDCYELKGNFVDRIIDGIHRQQHICQECGYELHYLDVASVQVNRAREEIYQKRCKAFKPIGERISEIQGRLLREEQVSDIEMVLYMMLEHKRR